MLFFNINALKKELKENKERFLHDFYVQMTQNAT